MRDLNSLIIAALEYASIQLGITDDPMASRAGPGARDVRDALKAVRARDGLEIQQTLVCSTGHMTVAEADHLERNGFLTFSSDPEALSPSMESRDYGCDLYIGSLGDENGEGDEEPYKIDALSPSMQAAIRKAWALGCTHLLLDSDAGALPGIDTHEW